MPLGWDAAPKEVHAPNPDLWSRPCWRHSCVSLGSCKVSVLSCQQNMQKTYPLGWFETCSLGCWGKVVHGTPQTMCRRRGPAGPVAALDCPGNSVLRRWAEWSRVSFYCPQHVMSLVGSQSHHVTSPLALWSCQEGPEIATSSESVPITIDSFSYLSFSMCITTWIYIYIYIYIYMKFWEVESK